MEIRGKLKKSGISATDYVYPVNGFEFILLTSVVGWNP